ncbi:methionine-R-sulfoxide reductase B2, mitochondrial isoform 1-T1 [Hipposideros larvatus]
MLLLYRLTADSCSFTQKKLSDLVEFWRFYNKLKMEDQTVHFCHILLFYIHKGKNACQVCEKLHKVYSDNALQERQCQRWFTKFHASDFDLNEAPGSGRPTEVDDDKIKASIESNPRYTTQEIADTLNIHHSSIHDHLKKLGYVSKLDIWVLHELKEVHLTERINICNMLMKHEENDLFVKQLITGDEKWIVYNNVVHKRSWSRCDDLPETTSKADIHQRKVMLSVWWDFRGVVFFELLPRNQTINSNVYCQQLDSLNESIIQKCSELVNCKGVMFHRDNARPHTNLITHQKLLMLGWDVLPHPPYSPDLAPSNFHLFHSLQNSLCGITFNSDEAVNQHLVQFFTNKDRSFYERGIMKLTERCQKVIEQNNISLIDLCSSYK